MSESTKTYLKLRGLRDSAGTMLHQRLTLAAKLLADRDWVTDPTGGGGHEGIAIDRLEDDCFSDVCGALSLPDMLAVLRAVPEESAWRANKYNLRRMWAEMKARQTKRKVTEPKRPDPSLSPEQRKIERLEEQLAEARQRLLVLERENKELRAALHKIKHIQEALDAAKVG